MIIPAVHTLRTPTGPPPLAPPSAPALRPVNLTIARVLLQQRCLGTLAHELGNVTSPLMLMADVLDATRPAPIERVGRTLRLVATSLARTATVCRFLRGDLEAGAFAPETIPDCGAWWTLCAPFVEEMLPAMCGMRAAVAPITLTIGAYEALTWASIAMARFTAETRPTLPTLDISGEVDDRHTTFILRLSATAARVDSVPKSTRQFLRLASWEVRRAAGYVGITSTPSRLECRIAVPCPLMASPLTRD